eukprot:6982790-Heterocapsa_arctica.AAC.1
MFPAQHHAWSRGWRGHSAALCAAAFCPALTRLDSCAALVALRPLGPLHVLPGQGVPARGECMQLLVNGF